MANTEVFMQIILSEYILIQFPLKKIMHAIRFAI